MRKLIVFDHEIGIFDGYALERFSKFGWDIEQRKAPKRMLRNKREKF